MSVIIQKCQRLARELEALAPVDKQQRVSGPGAVALIPFVIWPLTEGYEDKTPEQLGYQALTDLIAIAKLYASEAPPKYQEIQNSIRTAVEDRRGILCEPKDIKTALEFLQKKRNPSVAGQADVTVSHDVLALVDTLEHITPAYDQLIPNDIRPYHADGTPYLLRHLPEDFLTALVDFAAEGVHHTTPAQIGRHLQQQCTRRQTGFNSTASHILKDDTATLREFYEENGVNGMANQPGAVQEAADDAPKAESKQIENNSGNSMSAVSGAMSTVNDSVTDQSHPTQQSPAEATHSGRSTQGSDDLVPCEDLHMINDGEDIHTSIPQTRHRRGAPQKQRRRSKPGTDAIDLSQASTDIKVPETEALSQPPATASPLQPHPHKNHADLPEDQGTVAQKENVVQEETTDAKSIPSATAQLALQRANACFANAINSLIPEGLLERDDEERYAYEQDEGFMIPFADLVVAYGDKKTAQDFQDAFMVEAHERWKGYEPEDRTMHLTASDVKRVKDKWDHFQEPVEATNAEEGSDTAALAASGENGGAFSRGSVTNLVDSEASMQVQCTIIAPILPDVLTTTAAASPPLHPIPNDSRTGEQGQDPYTPQVYQAQYSRTFLPGIADKALQEVNALVPNAIATLIPPELLGAGSFQTRYAYEQDVDFLLGFRDLVVSYGNKDAAQHSHTVEQFHLEFRIQARARMCENTPQDSQFRATGGDVTRIQLKWRLQESMIAVHADMRRNTTAASTNVGIFQGHRMSR